MTSILDQLNFIRYSKDDFIKEKETISLVMSSELDGVLKIIQSNIKKSGGSNSPFQNSSFGNKNSNYKGHKGGDRDNSPSKSWRITKTRLVKENLSVVDKSKNEINSLLNKLSPKNFKRIIATILEFYEIDTEIDRDELLNNTIDNIFMKAVMQPVYCPYYVKFLKIIDEKYQKIHIINQKCIEFKSIIKPPLVNEEEISLSEKDKYDLFCKANKEKKYKEGYSQFIGELFNNSMINNSTLEQNISLFVEYLESSSEEDAKSQVVEDLLICICKLFDTVSNKEKNILQSYSQRVIDVKKKSELPKRLKFKLMDLHDLLKKRNVLV
jgi:hypothetical protein